MALPLLFLFSLFVNNETTMLSRQRVWNLCWASFRCKASLGTIRTCSSALSFSPWSKLTISVEAFEGKVIFSPARILLPRHPASSTILSLVHHHHFHHRHFHHHHIHHRHPHHHQDCGNPRMPIITTTITIITTTIIIGTTLLERWIHTEGFSVD